MENWSTRGGALIVAMELKPRHGVICEQSDESVVEHSAEALRLHAPRRADL